MTPEQIGLVQQSFAKLRPIQDATAQLFYLRLFEWDPSLQNLFPDDLEAQRGAVMAALGRVVDGLDDLETLRPMLRDLGRRHVGYGVRSVDYESFGEALLWTLKIALGKDYNAQVRQAWTAFYAFVSLAMMGESVGQAMAAPRPAMNGTAPDLGAP
ncbi:globin family protein [Pelagibius sp.]|uniref:globin family protein n=1 Tax=Pelagibius sp. TaxID=1931238 RepID=UPI00261A8F35|nr:globin family protein [Pelagibius sp.]